MGLGPGPQAGRESTSDTPKLRLRCLAFPVGDAWWHRGRTVKCPDKNAHGCGWVSGQVTCFSGTSPVSCAHCTFLLMLSPSPPSGSLLLQTACLRMQLHKSPEANRKEKVRSQNCMNQIHTGCFSALSMFPWPVVPPVVFLSSHLHSASSLPSLPFSFLKIEV